MASTESWVCILLRVALSSQPPLKSRPDGRDPYRLFLIIG